MRRLLGAILTHRPITLKVCAASYNRKPTKTFYLKESMWFKIIDVGTSAGKIRPHVCCACVVFTLDER